MKFSRRDTLQLGLAGLAGFGVTTFMPFTARAQGKGDSYKTMGGEILISPISHASFVMSMPGLVIYNDPVGGKELYEGHPTAGLVLITHEHQDHFDPETLAAIVGADTRLVVNPAVMDKLPADLKAKAAAIGNGEKTTIGTVEIEAIPAYNTTEDRKKYHPQGRDNGYVLTVDGSRVYIAGDTEDIPEMRALKDILVAFVPMNLPYTMDETQASSAVTEFKPAFVYPYHYKGSDPQAFAAKLAAAAPDIKVVQGAWYG
ncbi:MBL fold metallo-hydrolase [Mesorhizobium sp. KR9-304]|uniref:MBL fold metallo-hydrolase n=1 Tax=Mesorhizobium sp. KR9-304 TaxID=3156614 RepID=UPI0032B3BC10